MAGQIHIAYGTVTPVGTGATTGPHQRKSGQLAIFADRLRQFHADNGAPSMRELERLMREIGKPFPRSTISDKLGGVSKPSWEFVEAFVLACARYGDVPADLEAWRTAHRGARNARSASPRVPRELPASPSQFTGRLDELAAIDAAVATALGQATPLVLITGTAGVGKTALALAWSHRHASEFPDGQVYIDLRGYDSAQALTGVQALSRMLRSLGERPSDIPSDVDDCAARLRTVLSGARTLLVLDNASSIEQVRWLIPGDPNCAVLITSRSSLDGLVALHGARRVRVQPMPLDDAVELLRSLIGVDDAPALTELAHRCARLPLALRIVADVVSSSATPDGSRHLTAAGPDRLLDSLDAFDERASVRGAFSWSYRSLSPDAARMFRLLGTHPGTDFDAGAAAALAGVGPAESERLIAELLRAHLADRTESGRYAMHDLLRAYAAERSDDAERAGAAERLAEHYLTMSAAAMNLIAPAHRHERPDVPASAIVFADTAGARAWLDAERVHLVAFARAAAAAGDADSVVRIAAITARYFDIAAYHIEAVDLHWLAVCAARVGTDRRAEAAALRHLGFAQWRLGRNADAVVNLEEALALAVSAGEPVDEGGIRNSLGLVHEQLGDLDEAVRHLDAAARIAREYGDPVSEAAALSNLSRTYRQLGRMDDAEDCLVRALPIWRTAADRSGEGRALANRGFIRYLRGDYDEAFRLQQDALAIFEAAGDPHGQAWALNGLGRVQQRWRRHDEALELHRGALKIFREIGNEYGEGEAHDAIGDVLFLQGSYGQAQQHHRDALALARQGGHRLLETRALNGLADDVTQTGDPDLAYDLHKQALYIAGVTGDRHEQARAHVALARLYRQAGHPDAADDHERRAATALESPAVDVSASRSA